MRIEGVEYRLREGKEAPLMPEKHAVALIRARLIEELPAPAEPMKPKPAPTTTAQVNTTSVEPDIEPAQDIEPAEPDEKSKKDGDLNGDTASN